MFKRPDQTAGSTKQLRRTKLIQSYKKMPQKSASTKIMLTDLCPEEKAKVGELVKTLQARKNQNVSLQQQLNEMCKLQEKYQSKIKQMQKNIQDYIKRQTKYKQQIQLMEVKEQQRQRYITHLSEELHELKAVSQANKKIAKIDQYTMTQAVIKVQQGSQAVSKKRKLKQKAIQTEQQKDNGRKTLKKYSNSRSFQKIMRGPSPNNKIQNKKYSYSVSVERAPDRLPQQQSMENHQNYEPRSRSGSYSKGNTSRNNYNRSRNKDLQMRIEDQNMYNNYNNYDKDEDNQQQQDYMNEQEEDFDELAKKWLQLKQKNMSKIRQSYKKSKQKMNYDDLTKEFEQDGQKYQRYEQESFGPQRNIQDIHIKQEDEEGNFDQIQLNKILKSKDFSASRLMAINNPGKSSRINSQTSSKKSLQSKNVYKQKQIKNSLTNSQSRNVDFYETDLLDLVNRINY